MACLKRIDSAQSLDVESGLMSTVYPGMYFIGLLYDMAGAPAMTSCCEYTSPGVAVVLLDRAASDAADSGEPLPPEERDALQQNTRPRQGSRLFAYRGRHE